MSGLRGETLLGKEGSSPARRSPGVHEDYILAGPLQSYLRHQPTRPLARYLAERTGKPVDIWERWLTRVKKQVWVSASLVDAFASALDLHISMFDENVGA